MQLNDSEIFSPKMNYMGKNPEVIHQTSLDNGEIYLGGQIIEVLLYSIFFSPRCVLMLGQFFHGIRVAQLCM